MFSLNEKSKDIRNKSIDIFSYASRGHLPSAFSIVEILVTLYYQFCNNTPESFKNNTHDPIILSKGHGCISLYAILKDLGFINQKDLEQFCSQQGILGGHPTSFKIPGIEISTGSLGHGLSFAVGIALAMRQNNSSRKVSVILGDGECNEGSIWEAALCINKYNLTNLITIIDYNKLQSFASTEEVCPLEPFALKWKAFGFCVHEVDMIKKPETLINVLNSNPTKPLLVICHTIKGQGSSILENNLEWHHRNKISIEEINQLKMSLI